MSIFGRIKQGATGAANGVRLLRGRAPAQSPATAPQHNAVEVTVPNPFGGEPLCRVSVAITAQQHAHGESLRLQAHLDGCLRAADEHHAPAGAAALPAPSSQTGLVARTRRAGGGLLRYGLRRLPADTLAPLMQQRVQSWLDVQVSSRPLAQGVDALIPERLRALCADLPQRAPGEPRLATWVGEIGGAQPGVAQLTTLQIDQNDLPESQRARPFSLAASIATCVQELPRRND